MKSPSDWSPGRPSRLGRYRWAVGTLVLVGAIGWLLLPHSVNKTRYVSGNLRVLASIQSYPKSSSSVVGSTRIANGELPFARAIAYSTVREERFEKPIETRTALDWYRQRLQAQGWRIAQGLGQQDPSFFFNARRGPAYVQVMVDARGATLIVDHGCYARSQRRCSDAGA